MYSVKTQIFTVDPQNPDPKLIAHAVERLRADGLVSFPTETVYGLGANALSETAVGRIFEVKKRPAYDPLIVHLSSIAQIDRVAIHVPPLAFALAEKFWPGPLTLVLKKSPDVASNVSTNMDTVAVRMPDHKIPLALVEMSDMPIAAPSANLFTRPSPTSAGHVLEDLDGHVDVILDGGDCPIGLESTVLDLTASLPTVLRPGGLEVDLLRQHITDLQILQRYVETDQESPVPGPGMLAKHYSPKARLLLFTGDSQVALQRLHNLAQSLTSQGFKIGVMTTSEDIRHFTGMNITLAELGSETDLPGIGRNLFAQLRRLDAKHVDAILVRALRQEGLGLTIWDRLFRAAEGQVYNLEGVLDVDAIIQSLK